jgi:hypothetical protein
MFIMGKSTPETLSTLREVYGDNALKKSVVYDRISRFRIGQETSEYNQRAGKPSTPRVEEMIENAPTSD